MAMHATCPLQRDSYTPIFTLRAMATLDHSMTIIVFLLRIRSATSSSKGSDPLNPGAVFSYGPRIAQDIWTDPEKRMVKYFVDFVGEAQDGSQAQCGTRGRAIWLCLLQSCYSESWGVC